MLWLLDLAGAAIGWAIFGRAGQTPAVACSPTEKRAREKGRFALVALLILFTALPLLLWIIR